MSAIGETSAQLTLRDPDIRLMLRDRSRHSMIFSPSCAAAASA
jgi:hypothetical protein